MLYEAAELNQAGNNRAPAAIRARRSEPKLTRQIKKGRGFTVVGLSRALASQWGAMEDAFLPRFTAPSLPWPRG